MENPQPTRDSPGARARRSHGRATLADVAAHAGVTPMTVSRMLREPDRVAPETAQRVRQAIDDTGYSPNKQAGGLASGRSGVVAAIIPSVANSVFGETIQGLSDALQPAGLELFLAPNGYKLDREEDQLKTLLGWGPAAIAVTGRRHSPGALALMRQAKRAGTPVIQMWDQELRDTEFLQIGFNHHQVGVAMGEHLLACGYRDLAYVDSAVAEDFRAHERGQGLAQAARLAGVPLQVLVAPACEPMAAGRLALLQLQQQRLPRALAFANDHLAAGACLQALELGLALPSQVAVLGYGNFPISQHLGQGISTMATPRYQIGLATGQAILRALGKPPATNQPVLNRSSLVPALVVRNTTVAGAGINPASAAATSSPN
ncbi:MAG: LacI family DNA-binding transcriptional regulator [Rhodoferax sp.]|uniref:LacI family DNA-binding transcriptional regulator n=1 Tax=Rhodoferax sp. TaxID=50421 RepID=UPI001B41873C|nr:LacI family DNA-binding transcriptional regulator [Rhodoferax sp.]MBP9736043.1 LacI family DNA-binding transcriptional regulator [Rhodoferax sp.]